MFTRLQIGTGICAGFTAEAVVTAEVNCIVVLSEFPTGICMSPK